MYTKLHFAEPALFIFVFLFGASQQSNAQCPACTATTFNVNLSAATDTSWMTTCTRNGNCCTGTNCVRFNVTVNPNSDLLSFNVTSPSPSGSAYYQINCGPQIPIGNTVCIFGMTSVCITYCKPGGDSPFYHITASRSVRASGDVTLRTGCTGSFSVVGLIPASILWTSIYPGLPGAYNSYLSCTAGCTSTFVTPTSTTPAYIDYKVSGSPISNCAGTSSDTVRVYVVPALNVNITPANSSICSGGPGSVTLTANISGGTGPYNYVWSPGGQTVPSITVSTAGNYTVSVGDATGCAPVIATVTVTSAPTPPAPVTSSNSPVCTGNPIILTAGSIAGATYLWSGPNGFSSTAQNPSIPSAAASNAGMYSVVATIGGCTGPAGTTSVAINPTPSPPVVSSNSPVCSTASLNLTASNVPGVTYSWTGPNGFTSSLQNPVISNVTTAASGTYSVTVTGSGCTSTFATTTVLINPTPAAPVAANNSPVCAGSALNFTASAIAGSTYSWTGPNAFSSSLQNPSIANATTAASGTYSVTATIAGCTSLPGTIIATVNAIPAIPAASDNSPVCAGSTLNLNSSFVAGAAYTWSGPNSFSAFTQNTGIPNATTAASGTYSVTATIAGCTSPAGTVTAIVNPIPATPTASSNCPICAGSTLNLTASNVAGATYSWTGPNSFSSAIQNPSIVNAAVAAGGIYSVTATVAGCTSPAGTVAVTVNPIPATPAASCNSPVCEGSTLNLNATLVSGAAYSWTGPNAFSSTAQNTSIVNATTAASGTYSVTATMSGCTSPAGTVNATVNPIPATPAASDNSPVCAGSTLSLAASTVAGAAYSWTGPNSFSSSSQNPNISNATVAASGTYSVTATVAGCTSPAGTITATVNPIPATPTVASNSPVCAGDTLNLVAGTMMGASYSWSGPNSFSSALQNPFIANAPVAANGNYSVTATIAGCTSPAGIINVIVNPIPSAPAASSNSPVCEGSTLTLSANNIAGAVYSWTGPNGFTASSQNPNISNATVAASGTYAVTATVAGCASPAGTVNVIVNPIPPMPAASSNSPVCAGSSLNLNASTVTGATYSWTGPNSFSSALQNPSIINATVAASGTYSVTATVAGCTSPAGTVNATVNPIPATPAASGNSPICTGSTLNLNATTVAGAAYLWAGPNAFSATSQNTNIPNATTAASGTYSVTATIAGCTSPAGTVTAIVNPIPPTPAASSNSPVCAGSNLNLTASTVTGATYSWTGPNSFSSSAQNPSITNAGVAASGTYSVTATVAGCTSPAGTVTAIVNPIPATPAASSNSPVCAGSTLNLNASTVAGATYSWTGPNSFSSALQNPSIANATVAACGMYSVTATVAGCTSPAGTVNATVNPIPATPAASSNSPVCEGSTLNLNATTVSGAAYLWTGPNSFSASAQNTSITNSTTAASGTYSVTATVAGCTSPAGTVSAVVNPIPATPAASSNSPICAGSTLNLNATTITGATYNWTGPNVFTSSSQNPNIINATVAAGGTYSVTATIAGCTSPAGTVAVTVNPIPSTPTASSNSPVCTGNTLTLNTGAVAGAAYSWTGPNAFTSSSQNTSIVNATTAANGTYSVTVTVTGCTSPAGTVNVIVYPTPATPSPSGNSPVCTGNTLSLSTAFVSGASYSWSGPNAFSSTAQNPSIANVTMAANGTYSLTVTVNGCTSQQGTLTIVVNQTPTVTTASSNSPLCEGNILNLSSNFISGATYSWTGPNGFTDSVQNPVIPNATLTMGGTYYVNLTTSGCTGATASTSVIVYAIPGTPPASNNSPICSGQTLSLYTNAVSGATYNWTGPNGFSSGAQNPFVTNAPTAAAGTYSLTITVNGCTSPAQTITVVIDSLPTANAGPDQVVCANNATVYLNAASTTGTGTWMTSGGGTFTPSNTTLNATYNPNAADTAAGSVMLTFTTTNNGACGAATDQLLVTITNAPTVNAGDSQMVCANNPVVQLDGAFTISSGAQWSSTGSGFFSPSPAFMNATYTLSAADTASGSVTIYLTSTGYGTCLPVTDSIVITITDAPVLNAGNDTTVCINSPNILLHGTSNLGSGTWTTDGSGNFSNPNTLNTTYIPAPADLSAGSVLIFLNTTDKTCLNMQDTLMAFFTPLPVANAGYDTSICANNSVAQLNGYSSTGSGTWTSSGSGIFTPDANTLNATYTPDAGDTANGTVTLTLFTVGNGGCSAASDQVVVTITDAPVAAIAGWPLQISCANNLFPLNGTIMGGSGTGIWTTPNGGGIFVPSDTSLNTAYLPPNTDTAEAMIMLILTSTNNGGCFASSDTIYLIVKPGPEVNAGPDASACSNNPNVVLNGSINIAAAAVWTSSGSGTFSPDSVTLNATYIPAPADVTAGAVTIYLTSTGNGTCSPAVDSMLITYTPSPVANAGPDQVVCLGTDSVSLAGTISGNSAAGQWSTSGDGVFSPDDSTLNAVYILGVADSAAGNVTLYLSSTSNGNCFPVTDSLLITVTPATFAFAGNDTSVCENNNSVQLNGIITGPGNGNWTTTGNGSFSPNSSVLNASYVPGNADTAAGSVMLILSTVNSCPGSPDTMVIHFIAAPVFSAGYDATICEGDNVLLSANSNCTGIHWTSSGNGIFSPSDTITTPVYAPGPGDVASGGVTLYMTVSGGGYCNTQPDSMLITINAKPNASFAGGTGCAETPLVFTDQSACSNGTIVSWSWAAGNNSSVQQNPVFLFSSAGAQTVNLIVATSSGCSDTSSRTIYINPLPVPGFTSGINCPTDVTLTDNSFIPSGTISSWTWDLGNNTASNSQNPFCTYQDTGIYFVTLVIVSDSGCIAMRTDTILLEPCREEINPPVVPTAFTPNGDGVNDILYVRGGPFSDLEFDIYNEWGNLIFHSADQSSGWDGFYKSKLQPQGKYVWTVACTTADGVRHKGAGAVTIIR